MIKHCSAYFHSQIEEKASLCYISEGAPNSNPLHSLNPVVI